MLSNHTLLLEKISFENMQIMLRYYKVMVMRPICIKINAYNEKKIVGKMAFFGIVFALCMCNMIDVIRYEGLVGHKSLWVDFRLT